MTTGDIDRLRHPSVNVMGRLGAAFLATSLGLAACLPGPTPAPTLSAIATGAVPSPAAATTPPRPSPHASASATASSPPTKPSPCPGSDRTPNASPGRQLLGSSANWSGYVAAVKKTGVTCVEASWVEPSVTCPRTGHQAVAIWIGIDGFSAKILGVPATNVLVQIGTQIDCQSGVATHGAWREILPAETTEVPIPGRIRAGDHLSARISFASGEFTLSIFDAETLFSASIARAVAGAPRKTAEWIVEAPATNCPGTCRPISMPRFTPVTFTGAVATISGQRGAIDNDSWSNAKLRMVRGGITRTSTSSLSSGGTRFHLTFVHA